MGNLTKCLKVSKLAADEKEEIRVAAKRYQDDMNRQDAVEAAITDAIEDVIGERGKIARYIESRGGIVPDQPQPAVQEAAPEPTPAPEPIKEDASAQLAEAVATAMSDGKRITWKGLFDMADKAYGGNQASGAYTSKQAYDAMEIGINWHILEQPERFRLAYGVPAANNVITDIEALYSGLPTQSKRSEEQQKLQQFSTPHMHSYLMNWVADVSQDDVVFEPSAGTGNLTVHAINAGSTVFVNEVSKGRADLLQNLMPVDGVFRENASHVNSILPKWMRPTVVIMNPPFSADLLKPGKKDLMLGAKHIEEALNRLENKGRLVALVGRGMATDATTFKPWWKKISAKYDVRANIGISGKEYRKLGTQFDNQILVVDKVPPSGKPIVTGNVDKVADLLPLLETIRNERQRVSETELAPIREGIQAGVKELGKQPGRRTSVQPTAGKPSVAEETGRATGEPKAGSDKPSGKPVIDTATEGAAVPTTERRGRDSDISEPSKAIKPASITAGPGEVRDQPLADKVDSGHARAPSHTEPLPNAKQAGIQVGRAKKQEIEEDSASVFAAYVPALEIEGAQAHPTKLAESIPMASVSIPNVTYKPSVPQSLIKSGKLSSSQLEVVALAGQSHGDMLADGKTRRGFFVGNGTGVGKGAEISGIILDNWNRGRRKAVWISENMKLFKDANRDLDWVGMEPKKNLFKQSGIKGDIEKKDGVLFTTYDTLKSSSKEVKDEKGTVLVPSRSRLDQLVKWLGDDFDGVIAFDEAHNMGNSLDQKGTRGTQKASAKALAGIELQDKLPNARIVYVSATGATEVRNLAYADRLGLWGEGSAFADKAAFINQIDAGGVAAMEVVARDMKSLGMYESRSLSFDGVSYETLEHKLTKEQTVVYNKLAEAWQTVLANVGEAMEVTGADQNGQAKKNAQGAFWSSHQRFFSQIVTSMQVPSIIKSVEQQLKAGNSAVMQLVNTNEAVQERRLAEAADQDIALEDIDISPRDILMQYIQRSFPTAKYETYLDDNGNERSRPVQDADGNAVEDAEAVAKRDQLLEDLATIDVPQGAIDQVIDYFGPDAVAEITGRKRRIITNKDGTRDEQKLGAAKKNQDEADFMGGQKRILIFSDAGGTGRSYHSSLKSKNQQRRIHYLVQPGWRADKVMQGFGRTHRTNQASAPHYMLVTTDLKAQKRFLSSIARRLDQLGALTKGSRETASQGMFDATMNLENTYADAALYQLITDLSDNKVEGLTLADVSRKMALGIVDANGNINNTAIDNLTVQRFLNRLFSLKKSEMDQMFDLFFERLTANVEYARDQGTLDVGMEQLTAESVNIDIKTAVRKGEKGAEDTYYIKLALTDPVEITHWEDLSSNVKDKGKFARNKRSGRLYAFIEATSATDQRTGDIVQRFKRISPSGWDYVTFLDAQGKYEQIKGSETELQAAWAEEVSKQPKYHTRHRHLITGSLLPIWDRLPSGSAKIYRAKTDDGQSILGREIPVKQLNQVLRNLGMGIERPKMTPKEFVAEVFEKNNILNLSNNWKIKRSTVSGDYRLEITGATGSEIKLLKEMGAFTEIITFKNRVFIPLDTAPEVLGRIIRSKPVVEITERGEKLLPQAGPGGKQGGAIVPGVFIPMPRPRPRPNKPIDIITGYTEAGTPIIQGTTHPSLKDRSAFNNFMRRNFIKEGLLPDEVFERKIEMEGAKSEVNVDEDFKIHMFKKAYKQATGQSWSNATKADRDVINNALAGDQTAISLITADLHEPIRAMRGHLDSLSIDLRRTLDELIQVRLQELTARGEEKKRDRTIEVMDDLFEGTPYEEIDMTGADMQAVSKAATMVTIQTNLGEYLNRSYEAFDNKDWGKKVRKDEQVMRDARAFIEEQVRFDEMRRLAKQAQKNVEKAYPWQAMMNMPGSLSEKAAARRELIRGELERLLDTEGLSQREVGVLVEGQIGKILAAAENKHDLISFISSYILGQKDLGILKRRRDIPEPIRALLGEYKDPLFNYTRSASKMAHLIANHDFLMNVRRDGLESFLSLGPTEKFTTEVTAWEKDTLTPLTGLYTTKEFAASMKDAIGPKVIQPWLQQMLAVNYWVKYGKTVASPITTMRNMQSAAFFTLANGHFNWALSAGRDQSPMGIALGATVADLAKKGDLAKQERYIKKLIKLGVLHSGVRSEELWDAMSEAINMDRQHGKFIEGVKTVAIKFPQALYRVGDDFWKVIGFENELASLMRWRDMTRPEAEKLAAERIRNGYPTYSHVPRAIRGLRRFPFLGPFVSFPWEIARTAGHQLRFIIEDIQAGAYPAAIRRMLGMAIVSAAGHAFVNMAMTAAGVDDEEDEAIRYVGPTWQRNADLVYFRTGDGQLWSWDFSHLDPYTYLKKPISAVLNDNNDDAWKKLYDASWEIFEPFLGTEIVFQAFYDVATNTIDYNKNMTVYNPQADKFTQAVDSLNYLRRRLQPGISSQLENLGKAYKGEVSRGGKEYTVPGELATFVGFRATPVNPAVALKYRAYQFTDAKRSAARLLSYPLTDPNEVKPDKIKDPFGSLQKAHDRLYKDMGKAVSAAKAMGIDRSQLLRILKAANISERDRAYLIRGETPPWRPSKQFLTSARAMAVATAKTPEEKREAILKFNKRIVEVRRLAADKKKAASATASQ